MTRDVTERKSAEEALAASNEELQGHSKTLSDAVDERTSELHVAEDRLKSFMDSATDHFVLFDSALRVLDFNEAMYRAFPFKRPREEIIGRTMVEIFPDLEGSDRLASYRLVLKTGAPFHSSPYITKRSGSEKWFESVAFKIRDGMGLRTTDVTQRILAERRIRESEDIDAVDKLSSMVAHDIRSPLTTASQALQMAKKTPDKAALLISMAENNLDRAISMIEELRESTRTIKPAMRSVNLPGLIEDTLREKRLGDGVIVETEFGDGLAGVELDPSLTRRVFENLFQNASEAMPLGGTLKVGASLSGNEVIVTVTDSGTGISNDAGPRMFSPLYTSKAKGVGLGLSFCKRAVEAQGGSISFESKVGVGTVFSVRLPVRAMK